MEARPADSVTVKIPFAFTAAHQVLPAGLYRIEFLTNGEPGVDQMEVIALRGLETGSYTSLLARLGKSDATSPVMSFLEQLGTNALAELRAPWTQPGAELWWGEHRGPCRKLAGRGAPG